MAVYQFRLPDIGEGIAEAEVVAWHVKLGDLVEEDEPLVDMMTDKATVEMTAPVSGRLLSMAGEVGEMIAIGSVLASLEVEGGTIDGDMERGPVEDAVAYEAVPASRVEEVLPAQPTSPPEDITTASGGDGQVDLQMEGPQRNFASPAVRRRAKDLGIDLAQVKGEGGRIRHGDLDAFLTYNREYGTAATRRADEAVPVIGLRRRIAENMTASKRHIPHFSYVEELDVTKLEDLRAELNNRGGDRPRLTILPLLITAFCRALPQFPMLNARYDDEKGVVTRFGSVHLGVATQTPQGLMVPVVRDAETLNLWQLASEISRLAEAARSGKARSEELSGSTLTVTSLGPLGGVATTPVINRPEVAILGPNKVMERPAFQGRELVKIKTMNLSISCDHRVVDGWDAASFVQEVKRLVEMPTLLFV